ncbi:MFS transporter, YNFM family, putative membrane transport protein [Lentzea fradiae]|uniref:MFS transporter, YNFM family, putative membrane transport protein n=1 Tax=Lentzea fradiae TaxID=200378 RepID=A0A1G7WW20_9PSEU|nr:MFS transporter [Lentzea fradiae]SDG76147.1 MFS transporter, YNFM family, putative membrane transport protein [Lentzea fradiae]
MNRLTASIAASGFACFALLYTPQPVLPEIARDYGLGPSGASLALSAATLALAAAVVPVAMLSERVGRRPVIVASVLVAALLGIALPFAPTYDVFLVLRVLQGVAAAGVPAASMAYLADELDKRGLGAAMGAMIAGNSLGGMTGRLVTGMTADWLSWRGSVLLAGVFGLVAALVVVFLLPKAVSGPKRAPRGMRAALTDPVLLSLYVVAVLLVGAFISFYNVAGFQLTGPVWLETLVFLFYGLGSTSAAFAGRLADRYGRGRVLQMCIGVLALGAVASLAWVPLGLAVVTAGFFAAHATASGWVGARAPENARGQASGLYLCGFYVGSSIGGTSGSASYEQWGWGGLVLVVLGWFALAAMLAHNSGARVRHEAAEAQKSSATVMRPSSGAIGVVPSRGSSGVPPTRPTETERASAGISTTTAKGSGPPS